MPVYDGVKLQGGEADTVHSGDEMLVKKSFSYDKLGRVASETDGNGWETNRTRYEGATTKKVEQTIDESGNPMTESTSETTDANGQAVKTVNAAGETTTSTYDAFGNEIESVNEEGQQITQRFDAFGRLTRACRAGRCIRHDADGHIYAGCLG